MHQTHPNLKGKIPATTSSLYHAISIQNHATSKQGNYNIKFMKAVSTKSTCNKDTMEP